MTKDSPSNRQLTCRPEKGGYAIKFSAMASPCEVFVDTTDEKLATHLGGEIAQETWRIETKYSRYLNESICSQINQSNGKPYPIDEETAQLLAFAEQCFQMSDGLFDITSGVLRRIWQFDGGNRIPSAKQVQQLTKHIGWNRVSLSSGYIQLQPGMELDLGGIGKEYATDKALQKARNITDAPVMVNFGGDLAVSGPRADQQPWRVGVEHPSFDKQKAIVVTISHGAIATSGDARRYLLHNGKRYGHILNPKTGWPVEDAPRSITVAAPKCIQAGFLATLALLQGPLAEQLLESNQITYWAIRE